MANFKFLTLLLAFMAIAQTSFSQTSNVREKFTNCAAAFLNDQLVVDEYTTTGKCVLSKSATGTLTVCTADLSPEKSFPTGKLKFMVGIRDANTKTICMYSRSAIKTVDISKIMEKCKAGDAIVLMTMEDEYALPHNEILVK